MEMGQCETPLEKYCAIERHRSYIGRSGNQMWDVAVYDGYEASSLCVIFY